MPRLAALLLLPLGLLAQASTEPALLPRPVSYQAAAGSLTLSPATRVAFAKDVPAFHAAYLAEHLRAATGVAVGADDAPGGKGAISLRLEPSLAKGYRLRVGAGSALVEGKDAEAVFHGVQTLIQLAALGGGKVAGCEIADHARFGWRGLMLDSSRHFQTVAEIKVLLDQMALHKMNVFHWHLTDDQGWRIEIKSRPRLTEVGAWRVPREGIWWFRPGPQKDEKATYGGFYTQEQIKEVVAYATARHIVVMPEIDVPGHSLAILAAYPELSTTGGPFQVNPGSKFYGTIENTLDPSNPETFRFLEDVFSEVAPLFTSPFIHMGGDECTKVFWKRSPKVQAFMREKGLKDEGELQSWFVRQTEAIIRAKGKRLMGWDEILEGGLAEGASVMSWQGKGGGIAAARMGRDVVMSPSPAYYLDLYQGHPEIEPPTYGMARLRDSFLFDPTLPREIDSARLLGIQGTIWTEEIPNFRHLQYMTWPRAWAIAEEAWSPELDAKAKLAAWPGFVRRVERQFGVFDRRGWHYARSIYDPAMSLSKDGKTLTLTAEIPGLDIHYCFDDTEPDATYPKATGPLAVPVGADAVRTRTYRDGQPVGRLTWVRLQHVNREKRVP
ncbi:MAG: beta-N-acetylhexosaminidase [Opitutia bacterium]|jgi:hexosaminidase